MERGVCKSNNIDAFLRKERWVCKATEKGVERGVCESNNIDGFLRKERWVSAKNECVVPENTHTPTLEGIGNSEGVGRGVKGPGNSGGEGG